jgi:flagellar basal body rod protein FlgB
MDAMQATKKTKKRVRQIKRQLDLHSDDKVLQLLLSNYKDNQEQEESIKHQPSIRSQLLNLMSDGNTWNISDLTTEVSTDRQDYDTVLNFVESILESIPEITKVGDARYRLLIA